MTSYFTNVPTFRTILFLLLSFTFTTIEAQNCDNLTDGGTISGDESGCNNPIFDPSPILSTAAATGGSGTIEYLWMKTTGDPNSPFNTWQIIPGADGVNYDPTPITETTYFGRCSRRSGCTEYVGETNFVVKSISCCNINAAITPLNSAICTKEPLNLAVSGTGTGFTYLWEATGGSFDNPQAAEPTYTMMMPGTYTIKVTITMGTCMEMAETTVTVENQLPVSITADHTYLEINQDLLLNSTVAGSNPIFAWSTSGGTLSSSTSSNPTYTSTVEGDFEIYLTATDENGCSGMDTFNISVGNCDLALLSIAEDASCMGLNDGSITLTATGGTGTVNYTWGQAGIGNTNNPLNLAAGIYTVTATDSEGCTDNISIEIGTETIVTLAPNIKLPTCSGDSDGQILITPSGGSPNYTFNWSNGLPDTDFANNLPAGTYNLTVTDANGCQATGSYQVDNPTITLTTSSTDVGCGSTNGTATVVASGGTAPYTYAWNDGASQTTATATNLAGGSYQVIVTDANGCQTNATVTINAMANNIVLTTSSSDPTTCGSTDGTATVVASGGTAPYTYAWNDGASQTTATATNLAGGSYQVIVTDANGCQTNATVTINSMANNIVLTTSSSDPTTCGSTDGTATVVVSGGTAPYTYAWNDGTSQTTATATNLAGGSYQVIVTDANGCQTNATVTINAMANNIVLTTSSSDPTTCGSTDGTATVIVSGGVAPYTYAWNDGASQTTATATNLAGGSYQVIVTDANGCQTNAMVTINAMANNIVLTTSSSDPTTCGSTDGTATVIVSGGVAPYTYAWNDGASQTTATATNLAGGSYQVIVTDANGCQTNAMVTINGMLNNIVVTTISTDAGCGLTNGTATVATVNGGAPPYTYAWNDVANQQTPIATNLGGGTYQVIVTDANGCQNTATVTVNAPLNNVTLSTSTTDASCGLTDGTATVTAIGGTAPYTYSWNDTANQQTATATNLATGTYQVIVTDAIGCQSNATVVVNINPATSTIVLTATMTNATCGNTNGAIDLNISGGIAPYTIAWDNGIGNVEDPNNLGSGVYSVVVTDATGCSNSTTVVIGEEGAISVSLAMTNISCNGGSDGTATATPNGGTAPYAYNWSNGINGTATLTNLNAGTYTVTVTDANGCQNIASSILLNPDLLTISASPNGTDCVNPNGSAIAMVAGGTPGYTFLWSDANNQTTQSVVNLPPGDYTVTVTDMNGCTASATTTIDPSMGLIVTLATTSTLCNGENSGTIMANVANGTAPYSYTWNNFLPDFPGFTGLSQGTYEVTVTDANGCFGTAEAKVHGAAALIVSPVVEDADCNADDGRVRLDVTGGTAPYTYVWDAPLTDTTAIITNLAPGGYSFTVTDANGCTNSDAIAILRKTNCDTCKVIGGIINTADSLTICAGDGIPDNITVALSGNMGTNTNWIVTDEALNILELPTSNVFNFEGAGFGICYIWSVSYENPINGLVIGQNAANITGCHELSNNLVVVREDCMSVDSCTVVGGMISTTDSLTICAGDGIPDNITVALSGNMGANTSWIVTDEALNILELPTSNVFNFEGAGFGICYIWSVSYENPINGLVVGQNAANITGCHELSNNLVVVREDCTPVDSCMVVGGVINTTDSLTICAGDGIPDNITVALSGNIGANTSWIVTDEALNILELPDTNVFNFEGAGFGTCYIWSVSYENPINGLVIGQNAANITGCHELSNNLVVVREDCTPVDSCTVVGGVINTTDSLTICAGDGIPDNITVALSGNMGANTSWIVTDEALNILELPDTNVFNFEGAGFGTCYIWSVSYENPINGLVIGQNAANITGCHELSNNLVVVREDCTPVDSCTVTASTIATADAVVFCVGDGNADSVRVNLTNGTGAFSRFIITNTASTIIDISTATIYDFENTDAGISLLWNITYTEGLSGLTIGSTIDSLVGCFKLSNVLTIVKQDCRPDCTDFDGSVSINNPAGTNICAKAEVSLSTSPAETNYAYNWTATGGTFDNDTSATPTYSMMMPGTYQLLVTVTSGECVTKDSTMVTITAGPEVVLTATDATCQGINDGSISTTVTGGTAPFTYVWSDATIGNVANPNNVAAGTYNLTVTDANGCATTGSTTVDEGALISLNLTVTDIACSGASEGSINAIITGGIAPYTYIWSDTNIGNIANPTNLAAGTYGLMVVDANGCSATDSVDINDGTTIAVNLTAINAVCSGANQGTINTIVTGGIAPYTYTWSDTSIGNIANPTNLAAGTYGLMVVDANGCSATDSVIINDGIVIVVNLIPTNSVCGGIDAGSVSSMVSGGTAPYTYSWSNGATTDTIGSLAAGMYEVTVTDANGCQGIAIATVNDGANINITLIPTSPFCVGGNDGNITSTVSGGATPYTYNWSNGTNNVPNLTNLTAGDYSLTVTDANGCIVIVSATVSEGATIVLTLTPTAPFCAGVNDGSISSAVSGGTAPYTYNWSNGTTDVPTLTNLLAGDYNLTVTDANGCTATAATTINEGASITVDISVTNPVCAGTNEGSLTVNPSNGAAPYAYNWSNGATTATVTNLLAGSYDVTVTDDNGCVATATATIVEPTPFDVAIISTPRDICPGESVNFGAAPADTALTYQWMATGGSFDDATSANPIYTMMMPGTYEIILTASNGVCTDRDTTTVTVSQGPTVAMTLSDVICAGESTGSISVTASSDNEPITYTWDNGIGNIPNPTGLAAGTYNLTVTDAARCSVTASATIGVISNLSVTVTPSNLICNGEGNGSITATTNGGIAPITYVWSNGEGNVATINNLVAGSYSVTATDAMGCSRVATTTITEPTPLFVTINNSAAGDTICGGTAVNLTATPTDTTLTYSWTASGGSFDNATIATPVYTMMMSGTHEIIVEISNGTCTARDTTYVTIGEAIDFDINQADISCLGETDGSITVTVNSGAAPITYTWDNGIGNIPNPTGLAAGTYNLTVTDGHNCETTASVVINDATAIVIGLVETNILCGGENTGAVDALVIGGASPLSLAWSNGANDVATISNLSTGTYTLTVTDANGCTAIDSVIITEPTPLTAITEGADVGCNGSGHAHVTAAGGTLPYTYLWNDGLNQTMDTAFNLVAGVYNVTVTDANGCITVASVEVIETTGIVCEIKVLNDIETFNGTEGQLGVEVVGGSGTYTYSWNNGGLDSVINDLSTNTYIVTITDELGCTCIDTFQLLNPAILGDFVWEDTDSNGIQDIGEPGVEGVTLQVSGTTYYDEMIVRTTQTDVNGGYQFNLPPGGYKVTVVDALGFIFTGQNAGGDDTADSDFNPNNNMSPIITLSPNDVSLTIDLGLLPSDVCKNILSGGAVRRNETLCGPSGDPAIITNLRFPSGGVGQIEYLWLKSDITMDYYPGHPDWTPIPDSNMPDYDPGVITKTTHYIRCARRRGCNSYPGESNIITKTIIDCAVNPSAENLRTNTTAGQVELAWDGKIPYTNGNFIIERSTNGLDFKVVSTVASPMSETMEVFHFMDEVPNFGENYYRIKTSVPTMESNYSNIAMAMVKPNSEQRVMVYPNPVQREVTIHFLEKLDKLAKVHIVNSFGQVMQSLELDTQNPRHQVDMSDLPSGIYYLKFENISLKRLGQKIYKVEE